MAEANNWENLAVDSLPTKACNATMLRRAAMMLCFTATMAGAEGKHDCYCIYSGGKVEEGQTACIKAQTGYKLARCEKVLNNTSWKFLDTPCNQGLSSLSIMSEGPG